MIICNGIPKNGTNLLQKCCALMNFTDSEMFLGHLKPKKNITVSQITEGGKSPRHLDDILRFDNTYFCHAHILADNYQLFENHKVLNVFRDPRNAAVSFIRWSERRPEKFKNNQFDLFHLIKFGNKKLPPWAEFSSRFLGWLDNSNILNISFNELKQVDGIAKIADYLEIECDIGYVTTNLFTPGKKLPDGRDAYKALSSYSGGKESKWQDHWTDEIDKAWIDTGGLELLNILVEKGMLTNELANK